MELITGRSLKEIVAEKKSFAERLALLPHVIAVAEAVAYAHLERIIHRDLKPSNVLVGGRGEAVVIDWGLAKDLDHLIAVDEMRDPRGKIVPGGVTADGTVVGTPAYMPPEQARGEPVDERADVYSLGAVLYHCLCGHPPFAGSSVTDVLGRVLREAPPRLEEIEPEVPRELAAIVRKAMAADPAARYAYAAALAADLVRFRRQQPACSRA